jgi:hypothetical protein
MGGRDYYYGKNQVNFFSSFKNRGAKSALCFFFALLCSVFVLCHLNEVNLQRKWVFFKMGLSVALLV